MISSYFASVGVGVDKQSLKNVDSYLKKIENKIKGFQKRVEKTTSVNVRITLDQDRLNRQLRRSISVASRGLSLRLQKVEISRATLTNAINKAMVKKSPAQSMIKIDAQLSQASLVHMRKQVRDYLKGITVDARINARGGRIPRQAPQPGQHMSKRQMQGGILSGANPMLAGGAIGSLMRFGPYSLPFVAGAYGLNSLAGKAQTLESQRLLLNVSSQDTAISESQQKYLSNLGDRLGATTESMTPFFAQLVAGSRGTAMEQNLETGFSQFMDYASVVGLDAQQKEGALRAISQMLAKRRVQSEELRQQLAEHGMPMAVQIMADAVTGDGTRGSGDVGKLQKMMEMGQVDSIEALPKFFAALGREAAPWLEDYYKTISHTRGVSAKAQEDWMKQFLAGGGSEGVSVFFKTFAQTMKDSLGYAEGIGKVFERASYMLSAIMLAPGEIFSFLRGDAGIGNFMTHLFGDSSGSKLFQGILDAFERVTNVLSEQLDNSASSFSALGKVLGLIDDILGTLLNNLIDAFEVMVAFKTGGISAGQYALERNKQRSKAREIADFEADAQERDAAEAGVVGFRVPQRSRNNRANELFSEWLVNNPAPQREDTSKKNFYDLTPEQQVTRAITGVGDNFKTYSNDYMGFNPLALAISAVNQLGEKAASITGGSFTPTALPTPKGAVPINLGNLGLDSFGMLERATNNPNFMMTTPQVAPTIYQNNPITITVHEAQDIDEQKLATMVQREITTANEEMINSAYSSFPSIMK